jgi:BirA family transcriptional regulator, biotin operon repressor / biotin---[acetyl-CoA-carboxylase] ligase
VDSTNNYAIAQIHAGLASHGMVFLAEHQNAGKGQRGKSWRSAAGQNLTLSAVLEPQFLEPRQQFILSAATALACYDFLGKYIPSGLAIKWPNDLYWNDRKAGGILMESISQGSRMRFAVAGIGLNINQVEFPRDLDRAVSLRQITGLSLALVSAAADLCAALERRYGELKNEGIERTLDQYNRHLFLRGQRARLRHRDRVLETTIQDVTALGQLRTSGNLVASFELGEVEWIL